MNAQLDKMLPSTQMQMKAIVQTMQKCRTSGSAPALCCAIQDVAVPWNLVLRWCRDWTLGYV